MSAFKMTCTCGHVVNVEAANRDEAVSKIKGMWTEDAVAKHMTEKHAGEPVPSMAQVQAMIEQTTQPA